MKPKDDTKTVTLHMKGFPGVVNALGSVPGAVKFATRKIEQGDVPGGSEALVAALAKVELAKCVILSNLAFASMQVGDIGQCTAYVEIALESLLELGMEETEVGGMLKVAYACLPDEFKSAVDEGGEAEGEAEAGGTDSASAFDASLKDALSLLISAPAPSGKDGENLNAGGTPAESNAGETPVVAAVQAASDKVGE